MTTTRSGFLARTTLRFSESVISAKLVAEVWAGLLPALVAALSGLQPKDAKASRHTIMEKKRNFFIICTLPY